MRISKATRKDPTFTKKIVKKYENGVRVLVGIIGTEAKLILDNAGKKLEVSRIDTTYFNNELGKVVGIKYTIKAEDLAKSQARAAYIAGNARGADFLETVKIDAYVGMTPVDKTVLKIIEDRNISALMKVGDDTASDIKRVVSDGVIAGDSIRDIANDIDERTDIGINRAITTARTETLFAFNTALKQQYEKYGIEQVEWLTAWDDRVCETCEPLNERKFPMSSSPECPAHPNCRCTLLPVIEEV